LSSCKNETEPEINNTFEVSSTGEGIDCGLILIDFKMEDKDRIEKITGEVNDLRYFAFNLDKKFDQVGQTLIVTVRRTREDELLACTTQGPSYPWVTVLAVSS
jgi:hypothetical protein